MLEEYSDAELFEFLSKDDNVSERAFAEIYSRYASKVYAFCRRFLENREEAQDIFQETFIKFHECRKQKRDMSNMGAFLLTIARNKCVNFVQRNKQGITFEDYMVADEGISTENRELIDLLKMAMDMLPDEYREVFVLREYDGFSYQEIADIVGESLANVKIRIFRAKQKIKEILEPYIEDVPKYEK